MEPSLNDPTRVAEFIELFTTHQRGIYLYVLALVPNAADADEVLQETNLVLWQRFDQYQSGTNFRAWAAKIAHLKALEFYRRQQRNVLTMSESLLEEIAQETQRQSGWQEAQAAALTLCLSKLSETDRALIQRRYQPGADVGRLADDLGRPLRSVYKSVGRIRRALLACVERALSSEGLK